MNPAHPLGLGQMLCIVVFLCVALFELLVSRAREGGQERAHVDLKTGLVMLLMAMVGVGGGFVLSPAARAFWRDPFEWWQYLGFVLVGVGQSIRYAAIHALGNAFSVYPGVSRDQKLLTGGIYRLIRHPAYLGTLCLFVALAWIYAHPLSSALAILMPSLGLVYRIRVEEAILERAFGEEYRRYKKQTKRLVPYVF